MDNRLLLAVLLVTLSWMFMGTYAQANNTAGNSTAGNSTTGNSTAGNSTTGNSTTGNSTTGNSTAGNSTTGNSTAGNSTAGNSTAGNSTTGNNTTATNATTTAAPLTTNTTVVSLQTPISRAECGSKQLCGAEPADCDPSTSGSCFFVAAKQTSGRNFEFGLSGESDGYLSASLSTDDTVGGNDTTYICANDNGVVKFFGALLDNGQLTLTPLNVNSVKGSVNGNKIQCTFAATVPAATSTRTRTARSASAAPSFSLSVATGPFNSTSGALGSPKAALKTPVVNLADPKTNVTNEVASNTTTSTPQVNTTTAAPLTTNTTVLSLQTPISRAECGTKQLCAAEPADCDPSTSGSCFFIAAKQTSGRNFEFGLSGESDGYVAASLSTDDTVGGNDTTYICANDNGTVKFFGALLDNDQLTLTTLNVNSVKGSVNGTKIQCTFAATVPAAAVTPRTAQSFSMAVSTGTFNSTTGTLGSPKTALKTPVVNLADPNATVTNQVNATSAPTTTSHAVTLQQSLTQALLVIVGVLSLAML